MKKTSMSIVVVPNGTVSQTGKRVLRRQLTSPILFASYNSGYIEPIAAHMRNYPDAAFVIICDGAEQKDIDHLILLATMFDISYTFIRDEQISIIPEQERVKKEARKEQRLSLLFSALAATVILLIFVI